MKHRGCRDEVVLCTKVSSGGNADNIRKQVQASLKRLGVYRIDIYMLHDVDKNVPLAETLDPLNEQVNAGYVGAMG
mgnify:CR=1 FL=1